jgi:hypothetical protein
MTMAAGALSFYAPQLRGLFPSIFAAGLGIEKSPKRVVFPGANPYIMLYIQDVQDGL